VAGKRRERQIKEKRKMKKRKHTGFGLACQGFNLNLMD
jgi:hypothetical protein